MAKDDNKDDESIEPKTDRLGMDYKQGPNPAPGGELDVDENAPPYDERAGGRDDNKNKTAESVERQMAGSQAGEAGQTAAPGEESPAQEHEVTDDEPDADKGVGKSMNRSGEDMSDKDGEEAGRSDEGADPETARPVGTSDKRDITGVG